MRNSAQLPDREDQFVVSKAKLFQNIPSEKLLETPQEFQHHITVLNSVIANHCLCFSFVKYQLRKQEPQIINSFHFKTKHCF